MKLGILGSTRGTNLTALLAAIENKQLHAQIEIVISNKPEAPILQRAQEAGLHAIFVDPAKLSREEYDQKISAALHAAGVELVVLIGYMRILSDTFVNAWEHKIINIHPSLLPAFAGLMDLSVHRAVLESGIKETGCTVHYVTSQLDAGPVILQAKCAVLATDTPEKLKARVQQLEANSLIKAINLINCKILQN